MRFGRNEALTKKILANKKVRAFQKILFLSLPQKVDATSAEHRELLNTRRESGDGLVKSAAGTYKEPPTTDRMPRCLFWGRAIV